MGPSFSEFWEGTQDLFRDIPSSPLGPLRGRTVRSGRSGVDSFAGGYNVSFIVISVPRAWVAGGRPIINIWGTVSAPFTEGNTFVQFERTGQPVFNTVFIPSNLVKDAVNAGVPADDVAKYSRFVPDALTTTDNDGRGNNIAGRAALLTTLGLASAPTGAPLLLPGTFANTNRDLLRIALLPDVLRLDLNRPWNDLAIGAFGLSNGRRPGDDVIDIAFRVLRQLADVNFPAALNVPGSGTARAGALNFGTDRRVNVVLQGTQFIKPDAMLGDVSISGNDRTLPTEFPFLAEPHPRLGEPGSVGYPALSQ